MNKYDLEAPIFDNYVETYPETKPDTPKKGNFLVSYWGSGTNNPEFRKRFSLPAAGLESYNSWFDTDQARSKFINELQKYSSQLTGYIAISKEEGPDVQFRTVAVATVREQDGKEYVIERDYGYGYPVHTAIFDFEENNCSCCHRRRTMVMEQHPDCGLELIDDCDAVVPVLVIKFEIQHRE